MLLQTHFNHILSVFSRCVRSVRLDPHRGPAGEVSVRPGGVRALPVPQPTHPLRQAAPAPALAQVRQRTGHRAALLRAAGRQDAHRDAHPRHAAQRGLLQLALHAGHPVMVPVPGRISSRK